MASQEYSQLESTPALMDAHENLSTPNNLVCLLKAYDQTGGNSMPGDIAMAAGDTVVLGRNKDCTHKIEDSYVSGVHCKIWHQKKDNEIWIKDYSSNGTFIDGKKIGKGNTTTLVNGNSIYFSRSALGFTVRSFLDEKQEEMLANLYHFRGELGRGAFSVVKKAISIQDGKVCAVKVINKAKLLGDAKSQEQVKREIEILTTVRHRNVIGYVDCIETPGRMYIVLEYADGGELFDHIVNQGAFPEEDAKWIFLQLLSGVEYLHAKGIAHRDLKPENILVHEGLIKITDFGLAKLSENKSFMKTLCGTPQYVAPEIITMASRANNEEDASHTNNGTNNANGKGSANGNAMEEIPDGYTTAVDMWSLGVILYLLLTGRQPFSSDANRALSLYSQIETVSYEWPRPEDMRGEEHWAVSSGAKDMVNKLLQAKPSDRLSATEALAHPWMDSAKEYSQLMLDEAEKQRSNKNSGTESSKNGDSHTTTSAALASSSVKDDSNSLDISDLNPSEAERSTASKGQKGQKETPKDSKIKKAPFSPVPAPDFSPLSPSGMDIDSTTPSNKKKRPHHSLNEESGANAPKPPPVLPSTSGHIVRTMPARVSYKPSSANGNGHAAAESSNAMATDESSAASQNSTPASQGISYAASAAYIDANVKRRKLNDPDASK